MINTMRTLLKPVTLIFLGLLLAGCNGMSQPTGDSGAGSQTIRYDANSWKTMIPDTCLHYFDGCNICRRSAAGEVAACTRKACYQYRKPECLDAKTEALMR
jgi:hypothetical protein